MSEKWAAQGGPSLGRKRPIGQSRGRPAAVRGLEAVQCRLRLYSGIEIPLAKRAVIQDAVWYPLRSEQNRSAPRAQRNAACRHIQHVIVVEQRCSDQMWFRIFAHLLLPLCAMCCFELWFSSYQSRLRVLEQPAHFRLMPLKDLYHVAHPLCHASSVR